MEDGLIKLNMVVNTQNCYGTHTKYSGGLFIHLLYT